MTELMDIKKVLVVDDDREVVAMLKRHLEAAHYPVITAYDGEEGLEKIKTQKPDLVVLDIVMPRLGGYQLFSKIREHRDTKDIPVIAISAIGEMENLFDNQKISGFFNKPFAPEKLLLRIKEVFDSAVKAGFETKH